SFESMYPTLARPLSLMSRSYNEPLTTGSMLIEIGTDANSFSEAVYSAELVAKALINTLGS
ncbi:MAG: stage II sporulation protein P, partial [Clostridia bacterium]|nr:stage II sporulation protein P [Clostridia bacterium]